MRKEIQPIKICLGTFLSIHALSIDERRSARYWVKTNFRGRSQKKVAPVHGSVTKIDKSISQRSFPAYRVFVCEATLQYARDARIGGFHRSVEIAPDGTVSVKINGPRARGEMSFRRGAKNG